MRIGAVAKKTDCEVETIRYYEREGVLSPPARESSGYRVYGPAHLEELMFVRHCRSLDMKLSEIKQLLDFRRHPEADCTGVNTLLDTQIARVAERIAAMERLREQLATLRSECDQRRTHADCGIMISLDLAARGGDCPCHAGK